MHSRVGLGQTTTGSNDYHANTMHIEADTVVYLLDKITSFLFFLQE